MEIGDIVKKIRTSLTLKLLFIGFLLLLLQIPVWMHRQAARWDVSSV